MDEEGMKFMNSLYKISVIIPVYNAGKYLEECLECIQHSTFKDIEIICIDDGSTDCSPDILRQHQQEDSRIKIFRQENAGAGAARNLGIEKSSGKYLFFMDADDRCSYSLLEKACLLAEKEKADIVVFGFLRFNEVTGERKAFDGLSKNRLPFGYNSFSYHDVPQSICSIVNPTPWNKLIRRDLIIKNNLRYMCLTTTNDITFCAMCVMAANKVAYLPDVLYFYRIGDSECITNKKRKNLRNIVAAVLEVDKQAKRFPYYKKLKNSIRDFVVDNLFVGIDRYAGPTSGKEYVKYYQEMGAIFSSYPLFLGDEGLQIIKTDLRKRMIECRDKAIERGDYHYAPEIILSMTSYPPRIASVHIALESLFNQTRKADKIFLWLSKDEFPNGKKDLPKDLLAYTSTGLEIVWCDGNMKSHKKYLYAMRQFPEALIITVDDDLIYEDSMVDTLFKSYLRYPEAVSAIRTHLMIENEVGCIKSYSEWKKEYSGILNRPSMQLFATSGAGTLFPPHVMDEELFNEEAIRKCTIYADDLWLKIMQVICGTPVVLAQKNKALRYIPDTQSNSLWKINGSKNRNDIQLSNILKYFGKKRCLGVGFFRKAIFDNLIDRFRIQDELSSKKIQEVDALKNNMEKKLNDEISKNKNYAEDISRLETDLQGHKERLDQLQTNNEELQAEIRTLSQVRDSVKRLLDSEVCENRKKIEIISKLQKNNGELKKMAEALSRECGRLNYDFNCMRNSVSFRLGRGITWGPRKIRGGIRCYKEHGFKYTFLRTLEHLGLK